MKREGERERVEKRGERGRGKGEKRESERRERREKGRVCEKRGVGGWMGG